MTKIKTFDSSYLQGLDEKVNRFIKDVKVIDIKFDVVANMHNTDRTFYAMIMYEEEVK